MNQIIECYKDVWVNWKNFSGRTRRSGYWYAFLANMIVAFVLGFISGLVEPLSILVSIGPSPKGYSAAPAGGYPGYPQAPQAPQAPQQAPQNNSYNGPELK